MTIPNTYNYYMEVLHIFCQNNNKKMSNIFNLPWGYDTSNFGVLEIIISVHVMGAHNTLPFEITRSFFRPNHNINFWTTFFCRPISENFTKCTTILAQI